MRGPLFILHPSSFIIRGSSAAVKLAGSTDLPSPSACGYAASETRPHPAGRVQAKPAGPGLAAAVLETQVRISGKGNPTWPIASGNVANFALFLELLRRRSGFEAKML
jgi:hypothetical protein